MPFVKAERKKAKLRLALVGPSGSGKTYSALLLAKGLGGRVAIIDTERGSAELYADHPVIGISYDVAQLEPPYTPERYITLIREAERAGYDTIIIDSISHAWMGEGGLIESVDLIAKASKSQNKFRSWADVRPKEKRFIDAMLASPCHVIATIRTKTAWEVTKDENGKAKPVKIGLKPEQRDSIEYEFTTVLELAPEHLATVSKDRSGLLGDRIFTPSEADGAMLRDWLDGGAELPPPPMATTDQVKRIAIMVKDRGVETREEKLERVNAWLARRYPGHLPIASTSELTQDEAAKLIADLAKQPAQDSAKAA